MNKCDNITPCGPYLPCLKEGEHAYNLTPEALSAIVRKAYHDGYQFAKSIYYSASRTALSASAEIAKETNHGTY